MQVDAQGMMNADVRQLSGTAGDNTTVAVGGFEQDVIVAWRVCPATVYAPTIPTLAAMGMPPQENSTTMAPASKALQSGYIVLIVLVATAVFLAAIFLVVMCCKRRASASHETGMHAKGDGKSHQGNGVTTGLWGESDV